MHRSIAPATWFATSAVALALANAAIPGFSIAPAHAAWGEPVNLGANVNTAADEYGATLTADGLLLVFDSNRAGGLGKQDLYKSSWTGSAWGPATNLGSGVNTSGVDYAPSLIGNGQTLYFTGNDWDLYTSTQVSGTFGARSKVTPLNTVGSEEWAPSVSADGNTMILTARQRPGGQGKHDLWTAQRVSGVWQAPINVGSPINGVGDDYAGSLNAAGDVLYFARSGDLYQSVKVAGVWQAPTLLDGLVNTEYYETHPVLSADGLTLYFGSERPDGFGGYDIWAAPLLNGADSPEAGLLPTRISLAIAGPNPVATDTRLELALPRAESIDLAVFALDGRRVRRIHAGPMAAGQNQLLFDARDDAGRLLPGGIYFARAAGAEWHQTAKLLVVR